MRKRTHIPRHTRKGNPTCSTCGLPTIWSDDHQRRWCSVYGDHATPASTGRNVMLGVGAIGQAIRHDIERERRAS